MTSESFALPPLHGFVREDYLSKSCGLPIVARISSNANPLLWWDVTSGSWDEQGYVPFAGVQGLSSSGELFSGYWQVHDCCLVFGAVYDYRIDAPTNHPARLVHHPGSTAPFPGYPHHLPQHYVSEVLRQTLPVAEGLSSTDVIAAFQQALHSLHATPDDLIDVYDAARASVEIALANQTERIRKAPTKRKRSKYAPDPGLEASRELAALGATLATRTRSVVEAPPPFGVIERQVA